MIKTDNPPGITIGHTALTDEVEAVTDLHSQIEQRNNIHTVLFFCSPQYNLERLGAALKSQFSCQLIGCTTTGEITSQGYLEGGIVAAGFSSGEINIQSCFIPSLKDFSIKDAQEIADSFTNRLVHSKELDKETMFGMLLIDGLSITEEKVISFIYNKFKGVSLIGGSAGDELQLKETKIYSDGQFLSNAAVFTLFETSLPFSIFYTQHFIPTDTKMVITRSDPEKRIVYEINAEPAAQEYTRLLGISRSELKPEYYSQYPLMIRIADSWHIRSIQRVNEDDSLSFYCAIDTGLVLTLSKGADIISNLDKKLKEISRKIDGPQLIVMFDCILRKLEIQEKKLEDKMKDVLKNYNCLGFNTYGEQLNSTHINQTMTGVIIGSSDGKR